MQTLGLSDSTPRIENRLKSLLWPSIQSGTDVDYLGTQGYWVCAIVAVVSFGILVAAGQPIVAVVTLLFYYVGGVGVRERSRFAAVLVFVFYVMDMLISLRIGVISIIITALLLSNLRATWIASSWKPDSEEAAMPPRLGETWVDKFADQWPAWFWPKVRVIYYIFSICLLLLVGLGLVVMAFRRVQ